MQTIEIKGTFGEARVFATDHAETALEDTLDEAPFAYRGMEEIREAVKDTAEIEKVLRPVYNFKAGNMEG